MYDLFSLIQIEFSNHSESGITIFIRKRISYEGIEVNAITSHGDVVYFTNFPSGKVEIIRYNIGDETTTTSTTTFSKTTDTNNSPVTSGFEVFSLITAFILLQAFSKKSPNNQ